MSGRKAMDNPADEPPDTNWCAGGCRNFKETEEGRKLYRELHERYLALTKSKPVSNFLEK